MVIEFLPRAVQFFCVITMLSLLLWLHSTQAFVLNMPQGTSSVQPTLSSPDILPTNLTREDAEAFLRDAESLQIGVLPEFESVLQSGSSTSLSCPNATGDWWPGKQENLKSTCPWVLEKVQQREENLYPRFLLQAKCLCRYSVNSDWIGCRERRRRVTVFRLTGYQDGEATMKKEESTISINVGCYPVSNRANTGPSTIPRYWIE